MLLASLVSLLLLAAAGAQQDGQPQSQSAFNPVDRQYMQFTVSLDSTCDQVFRTSGPRFLHDYHDAVLADTRAALRANPVGISDEPATLASVRGMAPNCTDLTVRGRWGDPWWHYY